MGKISLKGSPIYGKENIRKKSIWPVGLGCMGMSHAYGVPADKKEMVELIAQAVDLGYTFFETLYRADSGDEEVRAFKRKCRAVDITLTEQEVAVLDMELERKPLDGHITTKRDLFCEISFIKMKSRRR